MTPPMRWLAVLAAGGAVAGGAAALGHASAGASTGVTKTSTVSRPAVSAPNKSTAEIRMLISETNLLQGKLTQAREELARVVAHPARTLIYKTVKVMVPGAPAPTSSTVAGQIASEQAALAAERAQLQSEQAQLGGEAQALAQRQSLLVKEAATLAAEAKKLAASHGGSQGGGHDD